MATNTQTALEIVSNHHHGSQHNDALQEHPCPASMESILDDQRTGAHGPINHQEPHFEPGVWTVMSKIE